MLVAVQVHVAGDVIPVMEVLIDTRDVLRIVLLERGAVGDCTVRGFGRDRHQLHHGEGHGGYVANGDYVVLCKSRVIEGILGDCHGFAAQWIISGTGGEIVGEITSQVLRERNGGLAGIIDAADNRPLVATEEEHLVPENGTADGAAELIALERIFCVSKVVARIEGPVAHKLEQIAVKLVGASAW